MLRIPFTKVKDNVFGDLLLLSTKFIFHTLVLE